MKLEDIRKLCESGVTWELSGQIGENGYMRFIKAYNSKDMTCDYVAEVFNDEDWRRIQKMHALLPLLLNVAEAAALMHDDMLTSRLYDALVALDSVSGAGVENDAAEREEES